MEGLLNLAKNLRGLATQLHESISRWEVRVALVEEATEHLSNWSLHDPESNPDQNQVVNSNNQRRDQRCEAVNLKIRHSYMASAKELQNLLSMKCKHLALFSS